MADKPYEEKLSDIMRFASEIVRTYRPRLAQPAVAPAELQQALRQIEENLRREPESIAERLAVPIRPGEYLTAAQAELATVWPDRAGMNS